LTLKAILGASWSFVRRKWFVLLAIIFLREMLSTSIAGLTFSVLDWKAWGLAPALIVRTLVWALVQSVFLQYCLNLVSMESGEKSSAFSAIKSFFQLFVAQLLVAVSVLIGTALLIVPGIYLTVRFSLNGFALVDQKLGAIASLKVSNRMLKGYGKLAALLLVINFVVASVSEFLQYASEAFFAIAFCVLYLHIRKREGGQ